MDKPKAAQSLWKSGFEFTTIAALAALYCRVLLQNSIHSPSYLFKLTLGLVWKLVCFSHTKLTVVFHYWEWSFCGSQRLHMFTVGLEWLNYSSSQRTWTRSWEEVVSILAPSTGLGWRGGRWNNLLPSIRACSEHNLETKRRTFHFDVRLHLGIKSCDVCKFFKNIMILLSLWTCWTK